MILRVGPPGKLAEVRSRTSGSPRPTARPTPTRRGNAPTVDHRPGLRQRPRVRRGLSNEEFSSRLRSIPFPFNDADRRRRHRDLPRRARPGSRPSRRSGPSCAYEIKGEPYLLAAYTCTPLVKVPVGELKPGAKVKGTTIAELGNRNRPLDMIVYQKDGKDYILMANSSRGVMKIPTEGADTTEGITSRSSGTKGLAYDTIASLKGVEQLDQLDKDHALVLIRDQAAAR